MTIGLIDIIILITVRKQPMKNKQQTVKVFTEKQAREFLIKELILLAKVHPDILYRMASQGCTGVNNYTREDIEKYFQMIPEFTIDWSSGVKQMPPNKVK